MQDWSALVPLCWWSVEEDYYSTGQAATLAWSLQRGGRNAGQVYAKQSYNPALDQLRHVR